MKSLLLSVVMGTFFVIGCASKTKVEGGDPSGDSSAAAATEATEEVKASEKNKGKAKKASSKSKGDSITCTHGSDKRIIEIQAVQPKGCQLTYTKFGNSDVVASSSHNTTYCEEVRNRIKGKLEAAHFNCS